MNRIWICLILALMMLVSSASAVTPEEFTLDAMFEANVNDKLLEKYSSICLFSEENGELAGIDYFDSTMNYSRYFDYAKLYFDGQLCDKTDVGQYLLYLYTNVEPDLEWIENIYPLPDTQELIEVTQEGDMLIVKTRTIAENSDEEGEVAYCDLIYTMDAQELIIRSVDFTGYNSGNPEPYNATFTAEYDLPAPEEALELQQHINPQDNYRTVTFVTDPGTENEAVYTAKALKGDVVMVATLPEYGTYYTDAECTQVYISDNDYTKDLTLYATGK